MERRVDYDRVADVYDRRYARRRFRGIEARLLAFARCARGGVVLEVGCGTGYWLGRLSRHGRRPVGLDLFDRMLARAADRLGRAKLIRGHAARIPLGDGVVDRVFCVNALHHFGGVGPFVAEARRVLRRGGGLMVVGLDPHTGLDRWTVYDYFAEAWEADRARYPSTQAIGRLLARAGFGRCRTELAEHLHSTLPARTAVARGWFDRTVTSQLLLLGDHEYSRGLERLTDEISAAESRSESLVAVMDLRLLATTAWVEP